VRNVGITILSEKVAVASCPGQRAPIPLIGNMAHAVTLYLNLVPFALPLDVSSTVLSTEIPIRNAHV